jgi:hypothetical protein
MSLFNARAQDIFLTRGQGLDGSLRVSISESGRPMAIDGSLELIKRGYHREAMLWIAVTHSRSQKVLLADAPGELTLGFVDSYQKLVGDLAGLR